MADHSKHGFATRSIHAGAEPDPTTGARATPINQSTAFVFKDAQRTPLCIPLPKAIYILHAYKYRVIFDLTNTKHLL